MEMIFYASVLMTYGDTFPDRFNTIIKSIILATKLGKG